MFFSLLHRKSLLLQQRWGGQKLYGADKTWCLLKGAACSTVFFLLSAPKASQNQLFYLFQKKKINFLELQPQILWPQQTSKEKIALSTGAYRWSSSFSASEAEKTTETLSPVFYFTSSDRLEAKLELQEQRAPFILKLRVDFLQNTQGSVVQHFLSAAPLHTKNRFSLYSFWQKLFFLLLPQIFIGILFIRVLKHSTP